jgi:lysyl-tRNA synthetase class 1
VDVETMLPLVGIYPEYLYQARQYRASKYAEGIRKALEHRETLIKILDQYRDGDHKIQGEWWPVSVFCHRCSRDDTEIEGWDGEWLLSYHCTGCGCRERVDLRNAPGVKLGWRVDWPMRWAYEGVDFEPAGKDHHSQGGSFDTARHVCKAVYGWDAPVSFRYDFIGIKGSAGKISSSSGEVIDLRDVLRVYTPELTRYLFAGTRPNTEFTISFDLDVLKIYEDYDKTERIAWGIEAAKDDAAYQRERRIYEFSQVGSGEGTSAMPGVMPYQVPFRHLGNLIQIADGDVEKALADLQKSGAAILPEQLPGLRQRGLCAKYWVEQCAPEEFRFRLRQPGERAALEEAETAALRDLRDRVIAQIEAYGDDKACAAAVYGVAEAHHLEGKLLFRAAYQALIGKDQGPRLANFIRSIDKDRLLAILAVY